MEIADKILTDDLLSLKDYCRTQKTQNKKIAICEGHFNVIHPGHLRFLEFSNKKADVLIVILRGQSRLPNDIREKFYDESERARGVASLGFIQRVFIFNQVELLEIIKVIEPDVYIKGKEFSRQLDVIQEEVDLVKSLGGKMIFSSGLSDFAFPEFAVKNIEQVNNVKKDQFHQALQRQNIKIDHLIHLCHKIKSSKILVIGDTIVDQYVGCSALGMSSEAPVLVLKELESKNYIGGAAIVAKHFRGLGANCHFMSLLGEDSNAADVQKELLTDGIQTKFVFDPERPTTFKIRYMVGMNKLLRVSRLKEDHMNPEKEQELIDHIEKLYQDIDAIVVSDFGYGVITPRILEYLNQLHKKHQMRLFGDVQSSSQIGNILKLQNYYMIKPNEKEARIALNDPNKGLESLGTTLLKESNAKNVILTLAQDGIITFHKTEQNNFIQSQPFPALNQNPIDVMGAGDSMLAGMTASSCAGANIMEASAIGTIVSCLATSKMGNMPILIDEVIHYLENF